MKKTVLVLTLLFAVTVFAHADTKSELTLKVQFLQEKARRLQLEYALTLQNLETAQAELRVIVEKEKAEKAEKEKEKEEKEEKAE